MFLEMETMSIELTLVEVLKLASKSEWCDAIKLNNE